MDDADIATLTDMVGLHTHLLARGHQLAARKTRYALVAFLESTLEAMRVEDGGKASSPSAA